MKALTGGSSLSIIGNVTTPTNVVVSTTGTSFSNSIAGTKITIKYLKATASSGNLFVTSSSGAIMSLWGVDCGTATGASHVAAQGGLIYIDANYTISGSATYHYSASSFGEIYSRRKTCTLSGTPAFTGFAGCINWVRFMARNYLPGRLTHRKEVLTSQGKLLINTCGGRNILSLDCRWNHRNWRAVRLNVRNKPIRTKHHLLHSITRLLRVVGTL